MKAPEPTGFFQSTRTLDINADLLKSNILNDHIMTNIKTNQIIEIDLKMIEMINLSINREKSTKYIHLDMSFNTPNLFEEFNSLKILNFSFCQIKSISFDILDCLSSNLTELNLCGSCKKVGYLKLISKLENLIKLITSKINRLVIKST